VIDGDKGTTQSRARGAARVRLLDQIDAYRWPSSTCSTIVAKKVVNQIEEAFRGARSDRLPKNSTALFLLVRIRDEAQSDCDTYNATRLSRRAPSVLDDIEGVGPVAASRVLRHFGSLKRKIREKRPSMRSPRSRDSTVNSPRDCRHLDEMTARSNVEEVADAADQMPLRSSRPRFPPTRAMRQSMTCLFAC